MSRPITVEDSSSDESDFYDNFNNMKAKIAKRQRKVQQIQSKFNKLDVPSAGNNKKPGEHGKTNEDQDAISDDDLLLNDPITIQPNGLGRCSPSNSIILDSDSSSSADAECIDEIRNEQSTSMPVLKERNEPVRNTCTIRINSNGNSKIFIHELDESIKCLIDQFAERTNCDPKRIILVARNTLKRCDPKETPRILGFPEDAITELDAFDNIEEDDKKMIKIKYQMKGKKIISAKVSQDMPFSRLKELFCAENNLDLTKVKFIFDSFPLKDTDTPLSAEMEDDDAIDVYVA